MFSLCLRFRENGVHFRFRYNRRQSTISSFHQSEVTGCQPPPHSHALPTPPVFDTVKRGRDLMHLSIHRAHTALCSLNTYVHSKEWGGGTCCSYIDIHRYATTAESLRGCLALQRVRVS
jgi:hypothetical protein